LDPDRVLRFASRFGEVEIAIVTTQLLSCNFERKKFKNFSDIVTKSLSCRISIGKKSGFSSTTNLERWKDCVERAVKIAKTSKEEDFYPGLPGKQNYKEVKNFSNRIEKLKEKEMIDFCKDGIEIVEDVSKRIKVPKISIFKSKSQVIFLNSNGIRVEDEGNMFGFEISLTLGKSSFSEFKCSRKIDFDPLEICRGAAEVVSKLRGKRRAPLGRYDVIFEYFPATGLVSNILISSICADNVQKKRSFFYGKIGTRVAEEGLNIIDDGTFPGGFATAKFDAEGVKTTKKFVIKNGILKNFLYDFYTAKKEGRESTGNCSSLARKPAVWATNFIIQSWKDDVKENFTGILVKSIGGAHMVNPLSGDFSISVDVGFYYEKGEMKYPVKGCMLVGNLFECLKNLEVGNDSRQDSEVMTPSLKFKNLKILS